MMNCVKHLADCLGHLLEPSKTPPLPNPLIPFTLALNLSYKNKF